MPSPNHRAGGSLSLASTGAALRRGDLKISDPIPYGDPGEQFAAAETVPPTQYAARHRSNDATWPRKSTPPQEFHVRHVSDGPAHQASRISAGPSIIPSSMSSIPSKASLNQKKPGGIRAALKRMFSSKRHRSVTSETNGYHYSDPGHLNRASQAQVRARLDSAPPFVATNATKGAALTSHSTAYPKPTEVDQSDLEPSLRRGRRNTLPSLIFSDKESDLAPTAIERSVAAESLQVQNMVKEDYVSDGQLKRRSRSADALNDLLRRGGIAPSPNRDRAGEIAYWRNSAIDNPVPVYSGQSIAVDPVHIVGAGSSVDNSERESSGVHPMQTFDFDLDAPDMDDLPLEQRINTLEIKLIDFEYAIAKLQGNDIPKPSFTEIPFDQGAIQGLFKSNNTDLSLTSTSSNDVSHLGASVPGHDLTFLSSPGESPLPSPEADEMFRPQRASKATTATIRPLTARRRSPRLSRDSSPYSIHIPPEKFEALLDMMREEKAARQKLEEQVAELQKEMEILRTPVYATIREAYPTPSPESSQPTPSARAKTLHRTQGFQLNQPLEISRFSGTEDSDTEDGFEDVYETPREERYTFETAREPSRLAVT